MSNCKHDTVHRNESSRNGFSSLYSDMKDQDLSCFIEDVVKVVLEYRLVSGMHHGQEKVVDFAHPKELENAMELELGGEGVGRSELLRLCQETVKRSVKTCSPYFRNQLFGGVDEVGLAGSWLTEALNTNQYTFEVAPFFTVVENAVLKRVHRLLGFSQGDGIFPPGGSMSNMYGMVLARYKKFPQVKSKGVSSLPPLVVFTSTDSHYSILKAAHWLGLGTENVVKVKTDPKGRMLPEALEESILATEKEGRVAFFVNATAGTTVLGAFDPLRPIARICKKYGLWLHVDGAWGGSVLLSRSHRHLLDGVEDVDSFAWNPHKMMGAPLQCSLFLLKEQSAVSLQGLLHECNSASATYLFQQDKFYDVSYDTGDKSVQCGRKVDAFKFWLMWKARGDVGLEWRINNAFHCARYVTEKLRSREGFRLVLPEFECTNVCFWYIPPALRGKNEDEAWWEKLEKVAPAIKERMMLKGSLMISYQPLAHRGWKNFFRLVITCVPPLSTIDMDYILDEIHILGSDLKP